MQVGYFDKPVKVLVGKPGQTRVVSVIAALPFTVSNPASRASVRDRAQRGMAGLLAYEPRRLALILSRSSEPDALSTRSGHKRRLGRVSAPERRDGMTGWVRSRRRSRWRLEISAFALQRPNLPVQFRPRMTGCNAPIVSKRYCDRAVTMRARALGDSTCTNPHLSRGWPATKTTRHRQATQCLNLGGDIWWWGREGGVARTAVIEPDLALP